MIPNDTFAQFFPSAAQSADPLDATIVIAPMPDWTDRTGDVAASLTPNVRGIGEELRHFGAWTFTGLAAGALLGLLVTGWAVVPAMLVGAALGNLIAWLVRWAPKWAEDVADALPAVVAALTAAASGGLLLYFVASLLFGEGFRRLFKVVA